MQQRADLNDLNGITPPPPPILEKTPTDVTPTNVYKNKNKNNDDDDDIDPEEKRSTPLPNNDKLKDDLINMYDAINNQIKDNNVNNEINENNPYVDQSLMKDLSAFSPKKNKEFISIHAPILQHNNNVENDDMVNMFEVVNLLKETVSNKSNKNNKINKVEKNDKNNDDNQYDVNNNKKNENDNKSDSMNDNDENKNDEMELTEIDSNSTEMESSLNSESVTNTINNNTQQLDDKNIINNNKDKDKDEKPVQFPIDPISSIPSLSVKEINECIQAVNDNNNDDDEDEDETKEEEISQLSESNVVSTTISHSDTMQLISHNTTNIIISGMKKNDDTLDIIKDTLNEKNEENKENDENNKNKENQQQHIDERKKLLSPTIASLNTPHPMLTVTEEDNDEIDNDKSHESQARPMMMNNRRHSYGGNTLNINNNNNSPNDLNLNVIASEDSDTFTTSSSDNEYYDGLDSSNDDNGLEEIESEPFDENNNSSQGSSPSKITNFRSSDIYNELVQRKCAMDSHYFIPNKYGIYMIYYLILSIVIFSILIIIISCKTFNINPKYIFTPNYNNHLILSSDCDNNNDNIIDKSYLMDYGHEFVNVNYNKYINYDSTHWFLLSIISIIITIFLIYPLILFIDSYLLIFRYSYYKNNGVDPLYFFCKFINYKKLKYIQHARYSSPNAPYLSSILDPNCLYYFNNNFIDSPNNKQQIAEINESEMMKKIDIAANNLIKVDDENSDETKKEEKEEKETKDKNNNDEKKEFIAIDDNKSTTSNGDDNNDNNDNSSGSNGDEYRKVFDRLLPLNLTALSPTNTKERSNFSYVTNNSGTTMVVEDSNGDEIHFAANKPRPPRYSQYDL